MKISLCLALQVPSLAGGEPAFGRTTRAVALLAGLALAACAKDPPEVVLVTAETPPPAIAAECDDRRDPKWQELPDRDVKRSEGARQHDLNKDRMRTLKSHRRICREALEAQFGPITPPAGTAAAVPARPARE